MGILRAIRAWWDGDEAIRTATTTRDGETERDAASDPTPTDGAASEAPEAAASAVGNPGPAVQPHCAHDVPAGMDAVESPRPGGAPASAADAGAAPDGAPLGNPSPADRSTVATRQERAAERLLSDEGLRGDLTDEEIQPLLDWALARADALAERTAHLDDPAAEEVMDAALDVIRETVRTAGYAVTAMLEGGAEARDRDLDGNLLAAESAGGKGHPLLDRERLDAALGRVKADPDLAGADLSAAIAEALHDAAPDGDSGSAGASTQPPDEDRAEAWAASTAEEPKPSADHPVAPIADAPDARREGSA